MLDAQEVLATVQDLWSRFETERAEHDRVYDFLRGRRGVPSIPEGSGDELRDIATMSVKNVLGIVVDSFAQNLAVSGFRSPDEAENDPAWRWWQEQRLDARQSEAHRPAISYGTSYAVDTKDQGVRLRTPRQLFAVYRDPSVDLWPIYALETWIDRSTKRHVRRGYLYDDNYQYPVTLGEVREYQADGEVTRHISPALAEDEEPRRHGASHCPVVRFVNARDAEDSVIGEVSPLIPQQIAINAVNFDRLTVSRFGAFPQKYAIGWLADSSEQLARVAADRLMAFEDEEVRVGSFAPASVEPYNSILQEMVTHVAMDAQIPLSAFGSIINLSAEALAMAEAPHQRKLHDKRESFGESWEQLLRLAGEIHGFEVSDSAEVIWRETEVRSFAQVVDGIVKLTQAGTPLEELLPDIPGWTQQRVLQVRAAMRRDAGRGVLDALRQQAGTTPAATPDEYSETDDLKAKFDALGVAIRAGVDPKSAAAQLGMPGLEFTGAVPVSLRQPESEAQRLEDQQ